MNYFIPMDSCEQNTSKVRTVDLSWSVFHGKLNPSAMTKFEEELIGILTNINSNIYGFAVDPCIGIQPTMGKSSFNVEVSLDSETLDALNRIAKALEAK